MNEMNKGTQKPVATVRVTNEGYVMILSTYVAYALPEGTHDLYAAPSASAQQAEPVSLIQALQDIGYEFGCPPGIKITDWLRVRLARPKVAITAIRKVKESLDPDDWCGDESMIDALERAEYALAAPAPVASPAALTDELDLIVSVLTGYPKSMARADALRAVDSIRRLLAASPADQGENV